MGDSQAARSDLVGIALAAGAGTRLRPLTSLRPKPLCPVGDRALLDWALDSLTPAVADLAVNCHHGRDQIERHVATRRADSGRAIHLSVEEPEALGTAGAVAALAPWLDGRSVLVVNADTWQRADLAEFVAGWDGERVRILTSTPLPFGPRGGVVASILPWRFIAGLTARPSGLWETVWRDELAEGRLDTVHHDGPVVDCATPRDYLRANLTWSGGESVVGAGADVQGVLERCVVWPGASVGPQEHLVDAIRLDGRRTVLCR